MPRYRVITPETPRVRGETYADAERAQECPSTTTAAALMRPHDFNGCAVWRHNGRARHWELIFDTTVAQPRLITSEQYWLNVSTSEHLATA